MYKRTVEELEQEIERLKEKLMKQDYGITWEFKEEKIHEIEFKEDKEKSINSGENQLTHYLYEGDNLQSLTELQKTMLNKVDLIYIDPPYNTGNTFIYKDHKRNTGDKYRHSEWLNFMYTRLKIAKPLLVDGGVIFISIDDNEVAELKLLMNKVFGEENFLGQITVVNNMAGRNSSRFFAKSSEYLLVYTNDITKAKLGGLKPGEEYLKDFKYEDEISTFKLEALKKTGKNSLQTARPNLHYPIYYNVEADEVDIERKNDEDVEILPYINGQKGTWVWGKERLMRLKDTEIYVKKNRKGEYIPYTKVRSIVDGKPRTVKAKSTWIHPKYETRNGTDMLKQMGLGNLFDSPKPVEFVKDIIYLVENKDAVILDFFAGSGTTGQAVMELNEEDGGDRQFILCTSNEVSEKRMQEYLLRKGLIEKNTKRELKRYIKENNEDYQEFLNSKEYQELGIARSVTIERLRKVVEGYTKPNGVEVKGLHNNIIYKKGEL